ncbi:cytochrome c-type biogenesis protein CcmH [Thalassotalea aquiviva]|uniref:cytochrome c-type biogenesis protein n=1 Tax=Thalassotalea aquiviva TaxID=3242415 RepID=UPI00352A4C68
MYKQILLLIASASLFYAFAAFASPVDTYVFKDEQTRQQFQLLTKELRCPKCQNQNLADSNSPIAADLREIIYQQLQQGKSNDEIIDYMVYRYGDFVLYKPKVNKMTYVLWFGPVLLFIAVLGAIFMSLRRRTQGDEQEQDRLSADEQAKLEQLIK